MKSMRFRHSVWVMLLCSWSGLARAQDSPNVEAGRHFERGLALAKQQAYPDAITEFNRAYQISPHFSVMYNLGQAYLAIDQPVYAVEALHRYLAEGGAEVPPSRRQQVEDTIIAQERRIASLTIHAEVAGTVVRIDGSEVGRTPLSGPIRISAGQHVVDAFFPGYKGWEQRLALAGEEQRTVDIQFEPAVPAEAPARPVTPVPSAVVVTATPALVANAPTMPQSSSSSVGSPANDSALTAASAPAHGRAHKITAIVVGVVGVGAIATGSAFGLRAFSKKSDSDKQCPNDRCTDEGVRLNDQAKQAATISTITFGVGLVAVGVATYLLLRPGSANASPSETSVGAIELAPAIASGQAGLTLRGVW
jgi:hypothetical protein